MCVQIKQRVWPPGNVSSKIETVSEACVEFERGQWETMNYMLSLSSETCWPPQSVKALWYKTCTALTFCAAAAVVMASFSRPQFCPKHLHNLN